MKLVELQCGTIRTWQHLLVRGASEGIRFEVPVKCFYIEHNTQRLLFDAGQKPLSYKQLDDANYFVKVAPHETAFELLRSKSIEPESINRVILSHLHADHTAGAEDFPQSEILLQQAEAQNRTLPWQNVHLINGEYDLFNDGRIILLPTPGHTPGHQSLLITLDDSSKVVLTGDAAYTPEALTYCFTEQEYRQSPACFDSVQKLRELQKPISPAQRPLTKAEAAKLLSVTPLTISRYMKSGKLRKICLSPRSVRVDPESVNALLQCQG